MPSPFPFNYPAEPHCRKHGPAGYSTYQKYRDWLRDEFEFRCVYCLRRETWEILEGSWEIDHFVPDAIRPDLRLEYDNLLYACHRCNLSKRAHIFPDPCTTAFGTHLAVDEDGGIHGTTPYGVRMIRLLKLDRFSAKRYRWIKIRSARSLSLTDRETYLVFMGYPEDLPDIEALDRSVPQNTRRAGVTQSHSFLKRHSRLPAIY